MTSLPEPQFIDRDPEAITVDLIQRYEAMTGKTLYPAQVDRLFIDLLAYCVTLVRVGIQEAAKQNLVAYARAPVLDYLGELVGVYRLPAQPARTQIRLTFTQPLAQAVAVPAGTRVAATGGAYFQATAESVVLPPAAYVDIDVAAVDPGPAGNGWLAGQINVLVDDIGVPVAKVESLAVTAGGADAEDDSRLRERIRLAPEAFSVAGSIGAYRHHAMRAHQDILDVAVVRVRPGVVRLHVLTKGGVPDNSIIDLIADTCSDEKVRPLTDTVEIASPEVIPYTILAKLTLYRDAPANVVLARARVSADAYVATNAATLGRDIVPSQIVAALSVPGVYSVQLQSPVELLEVPEHGWPQCASIAIELEGDSNG